MRLSELENELKGVMREAQGTNERRTAKYTEKRQQDKEMREFGVSFRPPPSPPTLPPSRCDPPSSPSD